MNIETNVLILGAGYASLILQNELNKIGLADYICLEKGYDHEHSDDYVVFTKNKFDFTEEKINVTIKRESSGSQPFNIEYSNKVYNKKIDFEFFSSSQKSYGYKISSKFLLDRSKIYGNVVVSKIDMDKKIVYGKVLHLNEDVEVKYNILVSTLALNRFAKMSGLRLLQQFNIFASYFPVGIKKVHSIDESDKMLITYVSDPNIPYYRKQHYKNTIYYEYCLNKPLTNEKFSSVIVPGKFMKVTDESTSNLYQYLEYRNVFMIGRNALWNPDFLLDHIVINYDIKYNFQEHISNLYGAIKND